MSDTWTLWGTSREVPPARPLPVTIDELDLVLWRAQSASLSLLDGACRHLGASLGHVGRIVDGCVRCPFHGWTYGSDGVNVDQPGIARTPGVRSTPSLRSYGATEVDGLVLVSTTATAGANEGLRAELGDALGIHESMGGKAVTGAAHRWVFRLPDTGGPGACPDTSAVQRGRRLVEWVLAGRDGDRSVPGTDPTWAVLTAGARVERSRGPLSSINGLHAIAPRVRFMRLSTDPVIELRTVGGGIHVARWQPHPAPLRPRSVSQLDAVLGATMRGARVVASLSALRPDTFAITVVGLYPDRHGLGAATAAAGDLLLRRRIGRRLTLLASALEGARIVGDGPIGARDTGVSPALPTKGTQTHDHPRAVVASTG